MGGGVGGVGDERLTQSLPGRASPLAGADLQLQGGGSRS